MKIAQAIPTSQEVANATNAGEPIISSHPKHPVSRAFNHLADVMTSASGVPGSASAGSQSGSAKRGLLRRRGR
jgi:MinD-like ATPase involved in chromosome partitioning or flagellar assembly